MLAPALLHKAKADLGRRPTQTSLILLTISAAATLLTLALTTLLNLQAPYQRTFEALNGVHLWLYFDRDQVTPRDLATLETWAGVAASTGLRYSMPSQVQFGETTTWVSLQALPTPPATINQLLIQAGGYPQDREILGSKDLHDLYQLGQSQPVTIKRSPAKSITLPVTGLAYNPTWDIYRHTQLPYLYLSEATLRELYPDEHIWNWSLGLRLNNPDAVTEVLAQFEQFLGETAIRSHTDWRQVRESAMFEGQLNLILLGAFSVFAIIAAGLVIANSINAMVLGQVRQIGVLKAIGFTQRQILLLYLGQYLLLGLLGSLIGLGLGAWLAPLPLKNVAASLNSSFRPAIHPTTVAFVMLSCSLVVLVSAGKAAWRGAKINTIQAIKTGANPPQAPSNPLLAIKSGWQLHQRLPLTVQLGLQELWVKPVRTLLLTLSLTVGVIGLVFGVLLNSIIEGYKANPALLGFMYDATLTRQESGHQRTLRSLEQAAGIQAFYSELMLEAETETGETFSIKGVEGDLTAFPFILDAGRLPQTDQFEALAGRGLLMWLGLKVGDSLTVWLDDRPVTWQIVGQYPEPANAGQMLLVSQTALRYHLKLPKPTVYRLKLAPQADVPSLRQHFAPKPNADLTFTLTGQNLPGSLAYLQGGVFGLAAILIGMALVNVFNSAWLAVQEKLRAISILKTVGMTPAQIVTMINTSTAALGLLATALGLPLGWLITKGLLTLLAHYYGFGNIHLNLNPVIGVILFPVVMGVSMIGSIIPARQAAQLTIVAVLRYE